MLTLRFKITQRARPFFGGTRYDFLPVDARSSLTDAPFAGLDRDQTYVAVYDYESACNALRDERYDPAEIVSSSLGGSIIRLCSTGAIYINTYFSSTSHAYFQDDLELALRHEHLFVELDYGRDLGSGDRFSFGRWLKGTRFETDHVAREARVPAIALVQRA